MKGIRNTRRRPVLWKQTELPVVRWMPLGEVARTTGLDAQDLLLAAIEGRIQARYEAPDQVLVAVPAAPQV